MNTTQQTTKPSAAADKPAQLLESIRSDTMRAYTDCNGPFDERAIRDRNLNFRAPGYVSVLDAMAIMAHATPGGYNEFASERLDVLPVDARIRLAREYSVCVYVETRETLDKGLLMRAMRADDFELIESLDGLNTYRIWWD